jgi:alpha-beta hydrolase superfamily lysophospholipase
MHNDENHDSLRPPMGIVHQEGAVERSLPGPTLHFRAAGPAQKPAAIVAMIHGYAEHGGRYAHVMDAWAERGIATVAIDLRGHGLSAGTRGHCRRFQEFLDDAAELKHLVAARTASWGSVPPLLFGHSFGGLVATSSVLADPGPWRALVLSAPYLELALPVPPAKLAVGKLVSRVWPTLRLASGLHGADVTRDAERARAYDKDPLVFPTTTARWFTEASEAQRRALDRAAALTLPLYEVVGTADRVAAPAAGRLFFERAGSKDKTLDVREGFFHEVLNEPEWRGVADKMADFILAHAAQ